MSYGSSSLRAPGGRLGSARYGTVSGLARSASDASTSGSNSNSTTSTNGTNSNGLRRQSSTTDLSIANLDNDEDFERLLASYDVVLVVDVLRRYLASEVQSSLAAGASKPQSAQIKRQFYERFNQILDRLFGNDDGSKHKYGGWLDYSVGTPSSSSSASSSNAAAQAQRRKRLLLAGGHEDELRMESYIDSLTPSGRALAEFLGVAREDEAAGSMFTLLFKMAHPVEFKLELELLPEQSKLSLLSRSAFTSVLFTQLLQKPITKQRIDPRAPVLLVSIKELFLFYFLRHPASANHQSGPSTGTTTSGSSSSSSSTTTSSTTAATGSTGSSLMGSLSDTLSGRGKRKENYSWRAFTAEGMAALTRGNAYNVLLLQYLRVFFPDSNKPVASRFLGKLLQHSNLFLHILIECWLRQNLIVFSDDNAAAIDWSGYRLQQKLVSPLAAAQTQTAYMAPSDDLLSSLLLTIIHLLSDSFYPAPIDGSSSSSSAATSSSSTGGMIGSGGGFLSPSVSVLRRPLYEFLRLVFSRAPIGLSPTAFLAVADVWLAYIQPWMCKHWAKDQSTAPASNGLRRAASDTTADAGASSSTTATPQYSSAWDSYVLANYHFYTTLLGAFIERAKELEFTGADERALAVLDRVLAVFTPELLALLRNASDFLDRNQPYSISSSSSSSLLQISRKTGKQTASSSSAITAATGQTMDAGLSPRQGQVLTYHCKALGLECIGVPLHGTFHRDAERVFDKLWSDSGFLTTGAALDSSAAMPQRSPRSSSSSSSSPPPNETPFERVHRLSRQLRRVFEISDAYVASTAHARSLPSANGLEPMEPSRHSTKRHLLTLDGLRQLRNGLRVCSPEELSFIGDPMLRPICSYEVPALVRLSYRVSVWLNRQLGLAAPYRGRHFEDNVHVDFEDAKRRSFRFNLRFLASKPNLAGLALLLLIVYLVLLW